jgi:hypothetical protein
VCECMYVCVLIFVVLLVVMLDVDLMNRSANGTVQDHRA